MSTSENPYQTPSSLGGSFESRSKTVFAKRSTRFAVLGAVTGFGFGFVVLAISMRSSLINRSLNDDYFLIDYIRPLIAFGFWSIVAGAFLALHGYVAGCLADIIHPSPSGSLDESGEVPESPCSRFTDG